MKYNVTKIHGFINEDTLQCDIDKWCIVREDKFIVCEFNGSDKVAKKYAQLVAELLNKSGE